MVEFKRELRYMVIKVSDIEESGLTNKQKDDLYNLSNAIHFSRICKNKDPLECVVVESDWPEYEDTWKAIESRCSKPKGINERV